MMGTDIHLVVEARYRDRNGPWYALMDGTFDINRNYELFRRLCGVRAEDGDPLPFSVAKEPRGMPQDMGNHTLRILEDDRAQGSFSWITSEEYRTNVQGIENSLDYLVRYIESCSGSILYEWRLVFGFDS